MSVLSLNAHTTTGVRRLLDFLDCGLNCGAIELDFGLRNDGSVGEDGVQVGAGESRSVYCGGHCRDSKKLAGIEIVRWHVSAKEQLLFIFEKLLFYYYFVFMSLLSYFILSLTEEREDNKVKRRGKARMLGLL